MTEEERAALYRQQATARERATLARWAAMQEPRSAYNARLAQTQPLMRDDGWEPVEYVTEQERDALGN